MKKGKKNVATAGRHITSDPKVKIAFTSDPKVTIAYTSDPKVTITFTSDPKSDNRLCQSYFKHCIASRLTGKVWLLVALLKLEKLSCDKHSSAYKS